MLTLKTYISQIKTVEENETVGYGRKGKLNKKVPSLHWPLGMQMDTLDLLEWEKECLKLMVNYAPPLEPFAWT